MKVLLLVALLLAFIQVSEPQQLIIGQITLVTCLVNPSPTNTINYTLLVPKLEEEYNQLVLHFHGDVPYFNVYALYGDSSYQIYMDSDAGGTGGELWLNGNMNYSVVVNCSTYSLAYQFTVEPVIPQAIHAGGGILVNDSQTNVPHSHWYYYIGDFTAIKSEICAPITTPVALRIVLDDWTIQQYCKVGNWYTFPYGLDSSFEVFSNESSVTIINGEYQRANIWFIFVGMIGTQRNLLPVNNQLIVSAYTELTVAGLYGIKAYDSLMIGTWDQEEIPLPFTDTDQLTIYTYDKALGYGDSACFARTQGKKFTGTISGDSKYVNGEYNLIAAENFFKEIGDVNDLYGVLVIQNIQAMHIPLNVNSVETNNMIYVGVIIGLSVFGALCVVAITGLCIKLKKRNSGYVSIQ